MLLPGVTRKLAGRVLGDIACRFFSAGISQHISQLTGVGVSKLLAFFMMGLRWRIHKLSLRQIPTMSHMGYCFPMVQKV